MARRFVRNSCGTDYQVAVGFPNVLLPPSDCDFSDPAGIRGAAGSQVGALMYLVVETDRPVLLQKKSCRHAGHVALLSTGTATSSNRCLC
mmetsp:Transcript_18168/g.32911  ORF Transcript_18168/g.32911 Transcript_18168/m.32911 type:complete len:90 (-) Transcript_18168:74-343(-)